jgi:hypothetical protein
MFARSSGLLRQAPFLRPFSDAKTETATAHGRTGVPARPELAPR